MSKDTTVFLSSTSEDLKEHREGVLHALIRFKRQVSGMEYFWRPGDPLEDCLQEVRNSGVYIAIIGTRYGSRAENKPQSFTELEYQEASRHGKKIFVYILDDESHPVLPKYVDKGEDAASLLAFKNFLLSKENCKAFRSPQHLVELISLDLIALFDDIGENVRAALAKDFSHLLVEAGVLFARDLELVIPLERDGFSRGGFRFGDKDVEEIMASAFLAQALCNNKFDMLTHFVTIRYEIWQLLIYFLKRRRLDADALANEIGRCDDTLRLRLLIKLAGALEIATCTEAICKKLFDKTPHHRIIQELQVEVTPFNKVIEEALRKMPAASKPVIQKYAALARLKERWQAKQVLESALKIRSLPPV
jgi:hypothetical protein